MHKFYTTNKDVFQRYFESPAHYDALLVAGNVKKLAGIITEKSEFNLEKGLADLFAKLDKQIKIWKC